jgi:Holliday junction DNA helicase RuvA
MIGYVDGVVKHQVGNQIILGTHSGVGYRIFVGAQLFPLDSEVALYIHHHVREDASDLYGFQHPADLTIFELLLTVSGVGPKMAYNALSTLGRESVHDAIATNQPAIFKSVSGIGQKVAEKIILELRNKIGITALSATSGGSHSDLIEALTQLGYRQQEIIETLKTIDASAPTDEKLRQALRQLAK